MKLRLPKKIREDGAISIVAPGSPVRNRIALQKGIELLQSRGYTVHESKHLYDRQLLYAGDDDCRAGELNRSFADASVSAIFCARGGAGSLRVLPLLDYDTIARNPKIFLGYSDTTAIQIAMLKHSGLVSFYGPMVETDLGRYSSAARREQLWILLGGENPTMELSGLKTDPVVTLYPGETSGRLVGGCLSIFVSLLGTPCEPDTTDAILFFEDIEEYPHRIDRYLTQLTLAGKLQVASGLIFGPFSRSAYPPDHEYHDCRVSPIDVIKDRALQLKIPSIYGLPFGHIHDPYTIPLGGFGHLDATHQRLFLEMSVH